MWKGCGHEAILRWRHLGQRHARQRRGDGSVDPVPGRFGRTKSNPVAGILLGRAFGNAKRPVDRGHDLGHRDCRCGARQMVAAGRAPRAGNQACARQALQYLRDCRLGQMRVVRQGHGIDLAIRRGCQTHHHDHAVIGHFAEQDQGRIIQIEGPPLKQTDLVPYN